LQTDHIVVIAFSD